MLINRSKIFQILNVLNKKERTKLKNNLHSIQLQNHLKLANILFDCIDNKISINQKEELFDIIFPNQIYEDAFFRLLMSDLVKQAEEVIVLSQLEKDPNRFQFLLLKAVSDRALERIVISSVKEFEDELKTDDIKDAGFHQYYYHIEEEKYKLDPNKSREGFDFKNMSYHLDCYFISERLRISSLMSTQDKILNKSQDHGSLTAVLSYLDLHPELLDKPAIKVFYNSYQLINHPEKEEHLDLLTNSIFEYKDNFPKDVLKDLLLISINFCIKQMNSGQKEYIQKTFELYNQGMDNGILLDKGNLTRYMHKNIITLGIRLQQYEWTEKFINEKIHLIDKKFRDGTHAYSLAYLAFEMKDYEKAAKLLRNEAAHDDQLMHLAAKNLLMKAYYLQNEIYLLELLLGSINSYLKRITLEGDHVENYTNILYVMRKLVILKQLPKASKKSKLKKLEKLKTFIQNTQKLTEKKWMLEQCEQLGQV